MKSLPSRERGLKLKGATPNSPTNSHQLATFQSTLREGSDFIRCLFNFFFWKFQSTLPACHNRPSLPHRVAPFTGAWIETDSLRGVSSATMVAPFTGAWIETRLITGWGKTVLESLPSRERGLKLKGATIVALDTPRRESVSIHAPVKGATQEPFCPIPLLTLFQSTLP